MNTKTAREMLIEHNKRIGKMDPSAFVIIQSQLTAWMIWQEGNRSKAHLSSAWFHASVAREEMGITQGDYLYA